MVEEQELTDAAQDTKRLRIVHVMRAPVGGLFRHVVDLARAQAAAGHFVGIIADSSTGGGRADEMLAALAPALALGVTRMKMRRLPHWSDPVIAYRIALLLNELTPDIVHGHGAKGGLYARLPALLPFYPQPRRHIPRVYTPHGGSLHFDPNTLVNRLYMFVEKALEGVTDLIPFESEYVKRRFVEGVGLTRALAAVVHNGIDPGEFEPAPPSPDAADFLYVGEWRRFKGVDTLIAALGIIGERTGAAPRLVLVGSGPDEKVLRALAREHGVSGQLTFAAPMAGRDAFRLGRIIVVPSRAESLPYVVLEAIGARVPIIATNVGGIPEIFGPHAGRLIPCDDPEALARAMLATNDMDDIERKKLAGDMAASIGERFSLAGMSRGVLHGYRDALRIAARRQRTTAPAAPKRV